MNSVIVYQGEPGAYSHLACEQYFPDMSPLACSSFADAFDAVKKNDGAVAMIPVENNVAGRVSDIYHLLPEGGLTIIGERYLPVHHQLLGVPGSKIADIKTVRSHPMALGQVRQYLQKHGIMAVNDTDTAGAARRVSELGDKSVGAVASIIAGEIYGLNVLEKNIEDSPYNTTRFLVLSAREHNLPETKEPVVSSYVFQVRSVPSALYKALGGFATNGVNITKLESYILGGSFQVAQFYIDVEAHPESIAMQHALEELGFYSERIIHLGTYLADPARQQPDAV